MTDLEPIDPRQAVDLYIEHKKTEYAYSTVQSHKSRLKYFLEWCARNDIENMNTLTGCDLYAYRVWPKNEGDLNRVSLKSALATLRAFTRFCESIEGVEQDLHVKIQLPQLSKNETV
ncbi:MAG: site-specific recombinase XerD [Natronomonas sp.]|jgi:site-specific recombinase XerD|uniref:site-specific integrase n=1 Tax=Natronomonas sp. TaxID=2184060 RepID=UPI003988A72B